MMLISEDADSVQGHKGSSSSICICGWICVV